jgi:hypothetical protein
MSAYLIGLKCPVCDESVSLKVTLSGGSPSTYDYPGVPPDVEWEIEDAEFECSCIDNIEANSPYTSRAKVKRKKSEPMFPGSDLIIVIEEHQKDEYGRLVFEQVQPLREAYFDALHYLAQECDCHYEPNDPY